MFRHWAPFVEYAQNNVCKGVNYGIADTRTLHLQVSTHKSLQNSCHIKQMLKKEGYTKFNT